jgi:hypothetical protein
MQHLSRLAALIATPMQKPTGVKPGTQPASIAVSAARIRKRHFG